MLLPRSEAIDSPMYAEKLIKEFVHIAAKKAQRLQVGILGQGNIACIPHQKESPLVLSTILFMAAQQSTSTRQRGKAVIAAVNSAHGGVDYIEIRFSAGEDFA